jgi:hypothetical protein
LRIGPSGEYLGRRDEEIGDWRKYIIIQRADTSNSEAINIRFS